MYKRFGQTFIAEKKGAQYFWVGTSGRDFSLAKTDSCHYDLKLRTTEFSLVTLFSAIKKDTVFYFKKRWIACGRQHIAFESSTELREQGLTVKLEPTYSSLTYSSWEYPVAAPGKK
jgi:hypothetical protein